MSSGLRVNVNPDLLRWARRRSGLESATLLHRFPKLEAWERREARPTFKQLEDFARATHTPVGFLFLQHPPVERVPIPDFRTVAGTRFDRPSPDLLDTVYLCQQRQDWYRDFARTSGEQPMAFVGSAVTTDDVEAVAAAIRHTLDLDLEERQRLPTWEAALRRLIEQADAMGILVMVSGVVGSNTHRRLDPHEFRGFALADPLAPLVFVNGADSKAAQMFTLAHELAHLWLGESAVSDADVSASPDHAIERWCNRVAAETLLPLASVRHELDVRAALGDEAQRLARRFKVSSLVALRRIYDSGACRKDAYWAAYRAEVERLRERTPSPGKGGDFFASLGVRVGKTLAHALVVSALESRTTFTEAFRLLGISKLSTFDQLAKRLGVDPS